MILKDKTTLYMAAAESVLQQPISQISHLLFRLVTRINKVIGASLHPVNQAIGRDNDPNLGSVVFGR